MLLKQLFEAPEKRIAVVAFGRMNPPTIGHQKLVEKIKSFDGDHYLFLSQTVKPKDNPLPFTEKLRFAKFFFPSITIGHPDVRTPMDMMVMLQNLGYTDIIYVAGSDRVASFDKLLNTYNGTPDKEGNIGYNFNSIKVVSAGERDPDADGAEGMSASKMRAAAKDGDLESFKQGVPQPQLADEMFAAVRKGMGLETEVPAESLQEGWLSKIIQNIPDYHEAVAEVFKILRQSKKFKNQDDSTIEKMAHKIVTDENNKPSVKLSKPKAKTNKDANPQLYKKEKPRLGQDYKNDLKNMSDEEFKQYYGWSKSAKDSDFAPDADIDIMKDFELWKRLKEKPLSKESVSEDSGYVIDAGSVRSTIISLIAGQIAKTDDIDQLAKWLKMIVGKELRPRGEHRYIITAEDIVHALESCKRHKKKIKEAADH